MSQPRAPTDAKSVMRFTSSDSTNSHPLENQYSTTDLESNSVLEDPCSVFNQAQYDENQNTTTESPEMEPERECTCQCVCGNISDIVPLSRFGKRKQDKMAAKDLSWRQLHLSRAKLKGSASTSDILAGFAMVALVEIKFNSPEETLVPEWLFILFSISTTLLVAIHIIALMISTYILPNIEAICKLHVRGMVIEAPHERMRAFIELAWSFSNIFGLFLFLINLNILCWIKFWDTSFAAAWGGTVIAIPVLVLFVIFVVYFYHKIVVYKVDTATADMQELERVKSDLDNMRLSVIASH